MHALAMKVGLYQSVALAECPGTNIMMLSS